VSVKRTNLYHSTQLFNTLIATVAGGHSLTLVTPECTREVIDPLYHSRHNDRDRPYERDRGISLVSSYHPYHCYMNVPQLLHRSSAMWQYGRPS